MESVRRAVDKTLVTQDASSAQLQPSRIRSIIIFAVLVTASISGAVVAQFTEPAMPVSIGQPDVATANTAGAQSVTDDNAPDPLAFGE